MEENYCQSCADYKITQTTHERCSNSECLCDCRGPHLDLSNVRVRLLVAQALQTIVDTSLPTEETPEAIYVNGLIKDFAREKMANLFGLISPTSNSLSQDEIVVIREKMNNEYVLVSDFEQVFSKIESMITVLSKSLNDRTAIQRPNGQPINPQSNPNQQQAISNNRTKIVRALGSKPMPSKAQFLNVTQEQSFRAVDINQNRSIENTMNELPPDNGEN